MATDLILPSGLAPSNLHLRPGVTARYIENDLYDICKRVAEVDKRLFIVQLEEGDEHAYAIMEHCSDGFERLVFRVKELDARVIDRLREIMAIPLHERLDRLEAAEYRWEAEQKEEMHERLYEQLGGPMRNELYRCGFIDTRSTSFPKTGVTGGKGSRKRS